MPRLFSICRTNVPVLHPNVPPPPHYYADNLARLLSAVSSQYSDLLLDRERDYLRRVFGLSVDAHRLYARLLTRRGPLVRTGRVRVLLGAANPRTVGGDHR